MDERANKILHFWFNESSHKDRFNKSTIFDNKIRINFFEDYQKAINNEYDHWQNDINECLALIILLDQFSRNLFRNNYKAFAMDIKSKLIAKKAIENKYHEKLPKKKIMFIFLPFMHSEKLADQIYCTNLIKKFFIDHSNYKEAIKYAKLHHDIIKTFGRFPYRNKVLGRKSTIQENKYLKSTHYDFFNI